MCQPQHLHYHRLPDLGSQCPAQARHIALRRPSDDGEGVVGLAEAREDGELFQLIAQTSAPSGEARPPFASKHRELGADFAQFLRNGRNSLTKGGDGRIRRLIGKAGRETQA